MKRYKESNIDFLENLPKRGNRVKGLYASSRLKEKQKIFYNYKRGWYGCVSKYKSLNPYDLINVVLKKFENKHIDEAFSFFCKNVVSTEHHEFYKNVISKEFLDKNYDNRCTYYKTHYCDDNGIIRRIIRNTKNRKYKRPITLSYNYHEYIYYAPKRIYMEIDEYIQNVSSKHYRIKYNINDDYNEFYNTYCEELKKMLEPDLIVGYYKYFNNKREVDYKKTSAEIRTKNKAYNKYIRKQRKEKQYSFLTKDEKAILEERQRSLDRVEALGFDENSFKYDPYHGQKRKKRKETKQ